MKNDETTRLRERAVRAPAPAPGIAISTMGDDDLEQLRRALAHALGDVRLGSPPSRLLGRLSRQTRTEQDAARGSPRGRPKRHKRARRQQTTSKEGEPMGFEGSVRETLGQARAQTTAFDAPDWEPLERVLPAEHCAGFMWMGLAPGGIRLYKHGISRRYLNLCLDPPGEVSAYRYSGRDYVRIKLVEAIDDAFAGIETPAGVYGGDARATPYDHEYRALRDRRLREAGWTVIAEPDST